MGRSVQYPKPKLRLKDGAWRIRWSANYKDFELATGHGAGKESAAETMRAQVELALRTGDWPAWAESTATLRKWRGISARPESARTTAL